MDYVNPIGKTGDKVPYVDADPANGIEGDPVASDAWEHPMLEIVNAIEQAGLTPDGNNLTQLSQAIIKLISENTVPSIEVGSIVWVAQSTAPSGWLKCNGALLDRTIYSDLFSVIGEVFGAGDGTTTFALPDLRGEFIRGWDDGKGVDLGRSFGVAQADEFKSHTHNLNAPGGGAIGIAETAGYSVDPDAAAVTVATGGVETRPRNIALLPCIKY